MDKFKFNFCFVFLFSLLLNILFHLEIYCKYWVTNRDSHWLINHSNAAKSFCKDAHLPIQYLFPASLMVYVNVMLRGVAYVGVAPLQNGPAVDCCFCSFLYFSSLFFSLLLLSRVWLRTSCCLVHSSLGQNLTISFTFTLFLWYRTLFWERKNKPKSLWSFSSSSWSLFLVVVVSLAVWTVFCF